MKNARRYQYKEILKRYVDYVRFVLLHEDVCDFEQQALKEYIGCRKQRGGGKIRHIEPFLQSIHDKFIISRIAVSVTNQCSLNCKDCNNLMPYCKEKFTISVEDQIRDLKKLLFYVDGIINVEIIGGEPFVYRQLPTLLQYLCDEPKVQFIEITSNGTVLPSKEVMGLLKDPKVCVLLSDYGKVNADKLRKTYLYLISENVCVQNLKNRTWISGGGIEKRRKSKLRLKYEYFHCFARKDCRTLYRGKLYVCGRAPILDELGLLTDNSSYIDIRNMDCHRILGKKYIRNFFRNTYAESCDYCDCSSDFSRWIESGIQK